MKKSTFAKDLTKGNIARNLFLFALPLFASNALQVVYNIVDMIVVGQVLGKVGMSGVAIGGDLLHFLTAMSMGFSSAGQVIIAQNIGAGRWENVKKIIGTLMSFLFILSLALTGLCMIFMNDALVWMETPEAAYDEAYDYTMVCALGLFFIYGYNVISAILRGMGDSKRPFIFVAIAAVLNAALDVLFVVIFKWRSMGSALATVIAQALSFIFALIYLYKNKDAFGFDFKLSSFKISKDHLKTILSLGIPMSIQTAAISFSRIIVARWINGFGVVASAVAGIYNKSNRIVALFANAISTAGGATVGQNIGAEKYDRVHRALLAIICMVGTAAVMITLAINIFPDAIFSIFTTDKDVINAAHALIVPISIFAMGSAGRTPAFSLINGSGNSKLNLAIALLDGIVFRVGLCYLFTFVLDYGVYGCWLGDGLAGFVPLAIGVVYYFSGRWKTNKYFLKRRMDG